MNKIEKSINWDLKHNAFSIYNNIKRKKTIQFTSQSHLYNFAKY